MTFSPSLQDLLWQKIALSPQQRLSFADYMGLVLYDPEFGYYSSGKAGIGAKGDFFTSSSLGPDFAQLWAEQFQEMGKILGYPQPFYLLEVGAGLGYFAQDSLDYLRQKYPDFYASLIYVIVESSPAFQAKQQALLENHRPKVHWHDWSDVEDSSLIGCIFSNELVDALPVHQIVLVNGQLQEVYLTHQGEVLGELSHAKILDYLALVGVSIDAAHYPDGYRTEVNLASLDWLTTVANKLLQGYLITVDYGYSASRYYHPQRSQGTLQCYYQHQRHNDPYLYLGCQDITTHVNFTALERAGTQLGLENLGLTQQALVLMALGLGDRLEELSTGNYPLSQLLQRRDALHQLLDPAGLGNFLVLLQGKGLTPTQRACLPKALQTPGSHI